MLGQIAGVPRLERRHVGGGRRILRHADVAQVVRQRPGTDDQDVFVAQGRQRAAQFHLPGRVAPHVQRRLHDGHVHVRVQVAQRHPGAVVQRAPGIAVRRDARLRQQGLHPRGQFRRPRRGVLQGVELRRKAAEVVPGHLLVAGGQRQAFAHPMRRHHQDAARLAALGLAPGRQHGAGQPGFNGQHGRAMGNE
ncbi:hypothetical protein D3C72_1690530 [compost metagenome]